MAQEPIIDNKKSQKLKEFSQVGRELNFKQQACFFLNAYWAEHSNENETCWDYVCKMQELEEKKWSRWPQFR